MVKHPEILHCFISPNESDRNLEAANVVDGLFAISRSLRAVADALYKIGVTDEETPMCALDRLSRSIQDLPLEVRLGFAYLSASIKDHADKVAHASESKKEKEEADHD